MHWKVEFDKDDAAVYGPNERGQTEDLEHNELMDAFELHMRVERGRRPREAISKLIFKQILNVQCNPYCETNVDYIYRYSPCRHVDLDLIALVLHRYM